MATIERRWVTAVTWTAIVAPVPYTALRVLWAVGLPVGIDAELLADFDSPGWGSLYILGLALLADATALLMHAVVRPRARALPAWFPLLGGRRVRPRLVVAALLLPTGVLAWRAALHLPLIFNGFEMPADVDGVPAWSLWTQVVLVWVWFPALAAATFAYHRAMAPPRARAWR